MSQFIKVRSVLKKNYKSSFKMFLGAVLGLSSLGCQAANQGANMSQLPSATISHYGNLSDQTPIKQVTLTNINGIEVDVISFGGIITRISTPDKKGNIDNIVLGMDGIEEYEAGNPYYGAIIGRFGNRIANGKFTLEGVEYQLATNDGDNHLHGGLTGFDRKVWSMAPFSTETSSGVTMTLVSPDGDQGYPGELAMEVTYVLTNNDSLEMSFAATTDKPTVVNMTQHSYFNLKGSGSILDHKLSINADYITPVDSGLIPTGELTEVAGTPFDFRELKAIGKDINVDDEQLALGKGFDHNFVLKSEVNKELIEAAHVSEQTTGRTLTVYTDEPAVQFYSGNFMDGSTSRDGKAFEHRTGFCLEPQHYPDSPNQAQFPSTTLLPGEQYRMRIVYKFGTE